MSTLFKVFLPGLILLFTVGCGDATPQVDFLNRPNPQKNLVPGATSSNNLSLTTTSVGGVYKIKGRVSSLESQKILSGGNYRIQGKISF